MITFSLICMSCGNREGISGLPCSTLWVSDEPKTLWVSIRIALSRVPSLLRHHSKQNNNCQQAWEAGPWCRTGTPCPSTSSCSSPPSSARGTYSSPPRWGWPGPKMGACSFFLSISAATTIGGEQRSQIQSWALSEFFKFFNNKNDLLHFSSS